MLGRVFKDKGSVGEGTREKRTFSSGQGMRLLRLDRVKQHPPRAEEPLPGTPSGRIFPLVPPRQVEHSVKERVGKCVLTGCKSSSGGANCTEGKPGQGVHQRCRGWRGALRLCQDQFQAGSRLATWGTQFMLFLVDTLQ